MKRLINSRREVVIFEEDGMYWCALCGDRPPVKECECGKHICGYCASMHICGGEWLSDHESTSDSSTT